MKKQLLLLSFVFTLAQAHAAKIRANNNIGIKPVAGIVYSTLDSAYKVASPGDTIYVEPSATGYTISPITKKINLIGNGFLLDLDSIPTISTLSSIIRSDTGKVLVIQAGGEGSVFTGLVIQGSAYIDANNLTFSRNNIAGIIFDNSASMANHSNININRNFIGGIGLATSYIFTSSFTNVNIGNNIFQGGIELGAHFNGIIENNTFAISRRDYADIAVENFSIQNNIIRNRISLANCSFNNNICSASNIGINVRDGADAPQGIGNKYNVDFTLYFVGTPENLPDSNRDKAYRLKPNSPAAGAGTGGIDCGAFGGSTPYLLGGQAKIPIIYFLTVPSNNTGNSLGITISTKSNQ